MLELRHLRYFVKAAELQHIAKAASALHISQSTLSHQIIQLEELMGAALFDRIGRNVQLTQAGSQLRISAQQILKAVEDSRFALSELSKVKSGELRIGVFYSFGAAVLPTVVGEFYRRYPNVRIIAMEGHAKQVEAAVVDCTVDLGVGFGPVHDKRIHLEPLFEDDLVLVIPEGHALSSRKSLRFRELGGVPLVLLTQRFTTRQLIDGAAHALVELDVPIEMDSVPALLRCVHECGLPTVLPRRSIVGWDGLLCIALKEPTLVRSACFLWNSARRPTPAAAAFTTVFKSSTSSVAHAMAPPSAARGPDD